MKKELTDEQFPYKVKFENTNLLGNITIDPDAEPQDLTLTYNVTFAASDADYKWGFCQCFWKMEILRK